MGRITTKEVVYNNLPKPSVLLYNITDNNVIFTTNATAQRPLASLTKLMTAVVELDSASNLSDVLPLSTARPRDVIPLHNYTREELLKAVLVGSDNSASETLAENYPGGRAQFLKAMDAKAHELGMTNTYFLDPHGHDSMSQSSVSDLLVLVQYILKNHPVISDISVIENLEINDVAIDNINISFMNEFGNIVLSKTGRSTKAGYCYAMALNHNNCMYALIMLGSPSYTVKEAFTQKLVHNYITRPFDRVE